MGEHIPRAEGVGGMGSSGSAQRAAMKAAAMKSIGRNIRQQATQALFKEWIEQSAFNPLARQKQFKTLKERESKQAGKQQGSAEAKAAKEKPSDYKQFEEVAKFYQKRNAEMDSTKLTNLYAQVVDAENVTEMLEAVYEKFSDPALADEALDYLLETVPKGTRRYQKLRQTKELLNSMRAREIKSGRNMGDVSRSHPALANAGALRELYRDITANPREAAELFEELIQRFNYKKMREALKFLLSALGADMTAKGPSISRAELQSLMGEVRNMQAILGVYRFFLGRGRMVSQQFKKNELTLSSRLHFEELAKRLVQMLKERYPSPAKILALADQLGIRDDIMAQIIIFTQFRDAMRGVSPRLFKNEKHRQDMLMTLIEALSELEDSLEEDEEEE